MNIFIKGNNSVSEQVYEQIKNQILSKQIPLNTELPSFRNLSKDLRISVLSTKKAYERLEEEGFIKLNEGNVYRVAK